MIWIILSFLFALDTTPTNKDVDLTNEELCIQRSEKYMGCTEELHRKSRMEKTSLRKEKITFQNACKKNSEIIEKCFDPTLTSCELIFFCVQKNYIRVFGNN